MEVFIRQAKFSDLEEILRLNKALFDYEEIFNSEYDLNWTYSDVGRKYFKERLENKSSVILIAELDKKIVGYMLAFINNYPFRSKNPIAEIENMYIDERFRGIGTGTKLMNELKRILKEKKVKRIKVEAVAQNYKAIEFYKKNGFGDFDVTLELKLD